MILAGQELEPRATWEFDADVLVLHHPTTISSKYQAMGMKLIYTTPFLSMTMITVGLEKRFSLKSSIFKFLVTLQCFKNSKR